jgi:ribosome biogenesis GTPase
LTLSADKIDHFRQHAFFVIGLQVEDAERFLKIFSEFLDFHVVIGAIPLGYAEKYHLENIRKYNYAQHKIAVIQQQFIAVVDRMQELNREGLVIRVTGGDVWVEVDGRMVKCVLRGRFRKQGKQVPVAAGDRIVVALNPSEIGTGTIEEVLPRTSWLSRFVGGRESIERLIVANVDMVFIVATLREPSVNYRFIDRVLASAQWGMAAACVCLNKTDLVDNPREIREFCAIYASCGYETALTSAKTGEGVCELKARIRGGVYAFIGESGVGKSSLLMKMDQNLNLKIRKLGEKSGKGRHTTSYSQLFSIQGGYMADTPGVQKFGFPGMEVADVAGCFPEFSSVSGSCRFQGCTHSHEPKCAIKSAVEAGQIRQSRYDSYLDIIAEVENRTKRRPK